MERNHTLPNRMRQVFIQPNIGMDGEVRHPIAEILNTVLADEAVLTMKTRSAHWQVRGPSFLDLRNLFEQQIQQLNMISDHIALRVRMLDGFVIGSFEEFLNYTRLEEQPGEVPNITDLLADHEISICRLGEDAQTCLEEYCDHDTYALLVRFTLLHEKMAGDLRPYIEPELLCVQSPGEARRN